MLNSKELGQAIGKAISLKISSGVISSKADVARHFKIQTPSIYDWIKKGSISKDKLPELWRYFSDVVGPEHWGLEGWPNGIEATTNAPGTASEILSPNLSGFSREEEDQRAQQSDSVVFNMMDVKASCGNGTINTDYPEIVRTLVMSPSEAQRLVGSTNRNGSIRIIVASKDSMAPTIQPDDLLFVDTAVKDYDGEAIYIMLHGGELVCKRLSLVGKTLTVISDNIGYPSWPWYDRPDETMIVGRVLRALPMTFKKFGSIKQQGEIA